MSKIKFIALAISGFILLMNSNTFGQKQKKTVVIHKGKGHSKQPGQHKNKVVVVHKSKYKPAKIVVYNPVWAPKKSYNRRWIYFPKHNCYWDNWRNVYFYKKGNIWVSSNKKPKVIINLNLENEEHYELKEIDDENDEIYITEPENE